MKRPFRLILIIVITALIAPVIANERPLFVIRNGEWIFPVFHQGHEDWNMLSLEKGDGIIVCQPPVPWTAGKTDYNNADFVSPFEAQVYEDSYGNIKDLPMRHRHWLGTDLRGTDVLSGMLNGLRITLIIGIVSTFIAVFIAFFIGMLPAWYAADGIYISWITLIGIIFSFITFLICLKNIDYSDAVAAEYFFFTGIILLISIYLNKKTRGGGKHRKLLLQPDAIMTRITEVFSTFPRFILVIVAGAFLKPSVIQVIFLLAITGWPDIARVMRAEILRLRELSYIDAGRISGAGSVRILFQHLLPNAWPVLSVTLLYSVAMNILLEAGLGFLGLGLPDSYFSLGGMMAQGKDHLEAWWIILFPGLLLTITLYSLYRLAFTFKADTGH